MILRESLLKEGVEKELAEINKEAESEVLEAKLQKITDAIDRRQSQLNRLDEDEDMKALTDKKKVKELQKEIKTLEKAKSKLEKLASKKSRGVKKEVIDEDEPIDETELNEEPLSTVLDKDKEKSFESNKDKKTDKEKSKNIEDKIDKELKIYWKKENKEIINKNERKNINRKSKSFCNFPHSIQ